MVSIFEGTRGTRPYTLAICSIDLACISNAIENGGVTIRATSCSYPCADRISAENCSGSNAIKIYTVIHVTAAPV